MIRTLTSVLLTLGAVLATGPVAASAGLAAGPGAAVAATCQGETPTITGSGGVDGTQGDDVILALRGGPVRALGGDDVICLDDSVRGFSVEAGPGDDRVLDRAGGYNLIRLGEGDDTYEAAAGDHHDSVEAGPGVDTVATGGGDDDVSTGVEGEPNVDVVDLGDGDDRLFLTGEDQAGASLDGGAGEDSLDARRTSSGEAFLTPGDWLFDNVAGHATLDGQTRLTWSGLEVFFLGGFGGTRQTFLGGPAAERAVMDERHDPSADLGGGDDELLLVATTIGVRRPIVGGAGTDLLEIENPQHLARVVASLPAGMVRTTFPAREAPLPSPPATSWTFTAFEGVGVLAPVVRVIGDAGPNRLSGDGCDVIVTGGAGPDVIDVSPLAFDEFSCPPPEDRSAVAVGQRGNDRLTGANPYRETLVGGPGFDRAFGLAGEDVCAAEREARCELDPG
ncbi:hypothetical protein [Nocardioides psychrotolerans]|uniref:hypothetical protein n=1 Tax=Nocardioides psychrotolerans TaxID=1005945 RepID=UPI003137F33B